MDINDFLKQNKQKQIVVKYKIDKVKEKQDYVILYLDNEEKISISVEDYFKYNIASLKGIDEDTYQRLINKQRVLLGYNSCLRKLSIKDYTVKQISDSLYSKYELHKNEVDEIINKLSCYGLLDDEKYCLNKIKFYDSQLKSYKQISNKLQKDGISKDLLSKCLINDNNKEYKKAMTLASKYANAKVNKSIKAYKQSILNKLVLDGFDYGNCIEIINNLNINSDNENELLNKEYKKCKIKYEKKYDGYELKNRIYNHLLNKGFNSNDIKEVMEV